MAGINIALEVFGIINSALLLLCCIVEAPASKKQNNLFVAMLAVNIAVLGCDALTWVLEERPEFTLLLYALNFLVYSLGYVLTLIFTCYLVTYISAKRPVPKWIVPSIGALCAIAILLVVVSLFNHMYFSFDDGVYLRGNLFWLSQFYPIIIIVIDIVIVIKYSKTLKLQDTVSLLAYSIIPIIAMTVQIKIYGITLLYLATTLSLQIIYSMIHVEQNRRIEKQRTELTQANVSIMLSQIRPHFLYNTLAIIKNLCGRDQQLAENVIVEFSDYLRGNLDSINTVQPICFTRELGHTKNFLELEKLQYKEKLDVIYDIRVDSFMVPTLTLQPIAENAVKYGFKSKEHITVKISSFEDSDAYYVTVEDDGPGFDPHKLLDNTKTHIGIDNVKKRLDMQLGSTLFVESIIGKGTKVTITVPKEGANE